MINKWPKVAHNQQSGPAPLNLADGALTLDFDRQAAGFPQADPKPTLTLNAITSVLTIPYHDWNRP